MRSPKENQKDKQIFPPLLPAKFLEYVTKFYQKLHYLDHKYSTYLYETTQQYTLLSFFSKAIGWISDGPALPLILFWYGFSRQPSPLTFDAYILFFIFFHELSIKRIFKRQRPLSAGRKKGFSFPSSHAFASGLIFFSTFFLPFPYKEVIYAFAFINVFNRPLLGVHYIMDVIVGVGLGAIVGLGWFLILSQGAMLP